VSETQWFHEIVAPGVRVSYAAGRVLNHTQSAAHEKVFIENEHFGRMLLMDGVVQTTTADEFIYHEMLSHVPILAHGQVKDVLIIGGGDCGLAEEVLKYAGIERVHQVEIDARIVSLSRTYLSSINESVFSDPRFTVQAGDGAEFVANAGSRFDLILIDSTDPGGVSLPLFGETFYRNALGCLKPGGVLVAQLGVPFVQPAPFLASMKRLSGIFPVVSCYLVPVPTYFGGPIAFGWASTTLDPKQVTAETLEERLAASGVQTRYYTPEIHKASFALPRHLQDSLRAELAPG